MEISNIINSLYNLKNKELIKEDILKIEYDFANTENRENKSRF